MSHRLRICFRAGFSLLELSVVLLVISLVAGFGISMSQNINEGSERITTQQRLLAIQSALNTYVAQYGYLPCPSDRAKIPTDSAFGVEQRITSPGAYPNARCTVSGASLTVIPSAAAPSIYVGAVPTQTLGLPANYAADAWGNKFLYAVSYQHVYGQDSYFSQDGPITIYYGNRTTNYAITTKRDNSAGAGAVYVVLSHGANGNGGYPLNSTSLGIGCPALASDTKIDTENCDDSNTNFYDSEFNDGENAGANFFDDYIVWGSNKLSRAPLSSPTAGFATAQYGSGCADGVCEPWCAPCFNAPTYTSDPNATTPLQIYVCQSIISSSAPNCQAKCTYGYVGTDITGTTYNSPCPTNP